MFTLSLTKDLIAAFNLTGGKFSDPILTDFGYHLILVTDSRPSDFQYVSDDAYENIIFNLWKTFRSKKASICPWALLRPIL